MKVTFSRPASISSEVYASLSWRGQHHLRDLVGDIVEDVGGRLEERIELPKRTMVGFADLDGLAAIRGGSMLFDTAKTLKLSKGQQAVIGGLAAHEYSHLSDDEVQPELFATSLGIVIAEGKADQLAHETIGDDDWGIYLGQPPSAQALEAFYQMEVISPLPQENDVSDSSSLPSGEPLRLAVPDVDIYGLGYELVHRVMSTAGHESIVPIHAQPLDYYRELLQRGYVPEGHIL